MRCSRCRQENPPHAKFCLECGQSLVILADTPPRFIDWYQQRIDATGDADLRGILAHNRDEEIEHAAMTLTPQAVCLLEAPGR